ASGLWGKGTYETKKALEKEHPGAKLQMIGIAGENGVKFASIVDGDERNAGRTGMGAVMGSKNLKAIVAIGQQKVEVANPEELSALVKKLVEDTEKNLMKKIMIDNYKKFGTSALFGISHLMRNIGIKNWQLRYWKDHVKISGQEIRKRYFEKQYYCHRCIIGCGRVIRYKDQHVHGPEYETLGALGTMCLNKDLDSIVEINYACNDYGMDTISTGGVIAFIMECSEKGLIQEKIPWGDGKKMLELVNAIARREEGLGKLLAEGVRKASEQIGQGSEEFAMQCKGLEIPQHDPRTGMDLAYSTTSRGADHLQGQTLTKLMGSKDLELTMTSSNAQYIKLNQDYNTFVDSLATCKFGLAPQGFLEPHELLEIFKLVTGKELSTNEMLDIGEKIFNLQRLLAIREAGDLGKLDRIQRRFTEKNKKYEEEIAQYYRRRFWTPNGVPSKMILRKLKISVPEWLTPYL
ncbi:MAG: aldehyde ferredoxin oxidoreductase family protein, partial [Candidatus Helarchaeales archaeon]